MPSARMKLPMNRKMTGSANGANATCAVATPRMTHSVGPSSAVTASGSASVIHKTIISASTAPTRCAGRGQRRGHQQNGDRQQRPGDEAERLTMAIERLFGGRIRLGGHAALERSKNVVGRALS